VARQRLQGAPRALDRFELEQAAFFERVRQGYLERARRFARIRVIDASLPIAEVQKRLESGLAEVLAA
jgi:dTMP kinase